MPISTVLCGSDEFIRKAKAVGAYPQEEIQKFSSGERCRYGLRESQDIRLVLVGPELIDVEPVNLIAALRKDQLSRGAEGCRLLLFERGEVSGSLSSRAHTAGANDVISMSDIAWALAPALRPCGTPQEASAKSQEGSVASPSAASGTVIIVASGRGGTGKTTISLLSAISLAQGGARTALLDFDLQFGDLAYLLGLHDMHTLDELAAGLSESDQLSSRAHSFSTSIQNDISFVASPRKPELGELVMPHVADILQSFKASFDYTVVNTGSFWTEAHAELIREGDICLLVMDQRISSVKACAQAFELCGRLGVPVVKLACVLNRFDPRGAIMQADASIAMRGAPVFTVSDGTKEVEELIGVGCPEELFALRNSCAEDIDTILEEILTPLGRYSQAQKSRRRLVLEARRPAFPLHLRTGGR